MERERQERVRRGGKEGKEECRKNAKSREVETHVQEREASHTGGSQGDAGTERKGLPWPTKVSQAGLFL